MQKQDWQDLLEKTLKDEDLQKKHGQLMDSNLLLKKEFDGNDYNVEEIKTLFKAAGMKLVACKTIKSTTRASDMIHAWYLEPNDLTQREALKEAYKLKGKYEPEAHKIDISNISDEDLDGKIQEVIKEITGSTEGEGN